MMPTPRAFVLVGSMTPAQQCWWVLWYVCAVALCVPLLMSYSETWTTEQAMALSFRNPPYKTVRISNLSQTLPKMTTDTNQNLSPSKHKTANKTLHLTSTLPTTVPSTSTITTSTSTAPRTQPSKRPSLVSVLSPPSKKGFPNTYCSRNVNKSGIPFYFDQRILRHIGIWPSRYLELTNQTLSQFVFGMASSSNHYEESLDAIVTVQQFFPDKIVYYYDIGLTSTQVEKIKKMCNVRYRKFDFIRFPGHVRNLGTYAFKPLVTMMLLKDFGGVFYMDTSVRLQYNDMHELYQIARRSDGFVGLTTSSKTVFQVTYGDRLIYLPTNIDKMKRLRMFQATTNLIYRTESVYRSIMYWWAVCSLDQYCIAPHLNKKGCICYSDVNRFCNCDRYDQSVLNLLVFNHYNFTETFRYMHRGGLGYIVSVDRDTARLKDKIKFCDGG